MKMKRYKNILFIILMITAPFYAVLGQEDANRITGQWYTEENKSVIEIFKKDGKYFGKIVWLKQEYYENGKPPLDENNPLKPLRERPLIGLVMMFNFEYTGDDVWENGKVYDPESGNTYSGKLTLENQNTLKARGFIGFSLIGRTTTWKRKK